MTKLLCLLLSLGVIFVVSTAHTATSPLAVTIYPPVQFPADDANVTGLRVGIWGEHRSVYGIDLGLIGNVTKVDFAGLAIAGLFNRTKGQTHIIGLQAALGANINTEKTNVVGFQVAAVNSNSASSSVTGFQIGFANLSDHTTVYGAQLGVYNTADHVYGFQIGLVNVAQSLHGLQIGLVNVHVKGLFQVCPIINFGF
jgi:hypothetical protein